MIAKAFTMKLKPGFEREYRIRHQNIWPELVQLLRDAGITDYRIFLEPSTGKLFALQLLDDTNSADTLATSGIMRKWWSHMADIMEVNPDFSPVCIGLDEVFVMK